MIRFLTAGESHGPSLTAIIEGLPAGLAIGQNDIDRELARRQQGYGSGGRMKIERDHAKITSGVMAGKTTGGPIALVVDNLDYAKWRDREIEPMTIPRPGHADLTGAVKYDYDDLRLSLERASARETTMRVAVGAVCRKLLAAFGVRVGGYVLAVGDVSLAGDSSSQTSATLAERFDRAEQSDVRCFDEPTAERMRARIREIMDAKDTLGGVIECAALGLPAGLGSHVHWDRKLSGVLAQAVMSIHSVKGVEIGDGFAAAQRPGTQAHDAIFANGDAIGQKTNRAGGLEGGITNGQPLIVRAALKPIATTLNPQDSVDLASGEAVKTKYERSDFCHVPRAVPIVEAMLCIVLANALAEKLGGDSIGEMKPRFEQLRQMRLGGLKMRNEAWKFDMD
ncbi:MAG TPA: chorismate synthase [Thermoflexales bacterium]|nr:chorismate synthase [Thermoflexales bacterium]